MTFYFKDLYSKLISMTNFFLGVLMFVLFFLIYFFNCCFAKPIQLIDKKNQTIDILHKLTGYAGPYTFECLKWRGKKPFVYKVDYAGKSCIVRFNEDFFKPGRIDEVAFHYYAQEQGFGPEVMYADANVGIIIMEYFTETQNQEELLDTNKQIDRLVACIKKIHVTEGFMCRPQDSFVSNILKRFSYMLEHNVYGFNLVSFQESLRFLQCCIDTGIKPVLVHGDLHRFNIFLCNDAVKLIDFEAVHYDHPYVDLAHLAIFFGLDNKEELYLLEQYLNRQVTDHDIVQFAIFKTFVLAKLVLWMFESLNQDFVNTVEYEHMFYAKPLIEFLKDPIDDTNPAWRYRAGVCALKEAEKLLIFLQHSFVN